MPSSQIRDWFQRRQQRRQADSRRLHLEELECRAMLSVTGGLASSVVPDVWVTPSMLAAVASQSPTAVTASTQVSSAKMDPVGRVVTEPPVPVGLNSFAGEVTPRQMQNAYGSNRSGLNGSGETIGIVEEGYVPFNALVSALNNFDHTQQVYGPAFNFTAYVAPGTQLLVPGFDAIETFLDIEWAHAMAPGANIYLAQFPGSLTQPLASVLNAANYLAAQGVPVISMSYGLDETIENATGDMALGESIFTQYPNTAFIVSSGDQHSGEPFDYPASSPNVIAVGGTEFLNVGNPIGGQEIPWTDSFGEGGGGGVSSYFAEPGYQTAVFTGSGRGVPDVSMDANNAWMYDSYDSPFEPWFPEGGTSLAAPMFAGLIADADQGRAQAGQAPIGTSELHTSLYAIGAGASYTSVFNDITSGSNNFFSAGPGYDLATGLGTPKAVALENALIINTLPAPSQNGPSGLVQTIAPTFSWAAVPGAAEYQLTIVDQATGKNVTTPVVLTGTSYAAPSGLLSAGHSYAWNVTAINSIGTGAVSSNLAFSTAMAQTTAPQTPSPQATYSLFSGALPTTSDSGDTQGVELGVQFSSTVNGFITGVRFYKGAANIGTHTGGLWTASGQLLATANFSGEGTSGWQQVNFSTPVAVTAGTTYVVSYHTTVGHYALSRSFFNAPYTSGPLRVPANGGVYSYGAGGFPTAAFQGSNYWVDPVLSVPAATTLSATPISSTQVSLSWSASGATSYNLYEFENGRPVLIGSYLAGVTSATIGGLTPGTFYAFNLVAITGFGPTASTWVGATTTTTLSATPISSTQVSLSWSAASGATSYNLYEFENGAPVLIGAYPASVTSVTISGLTPGSFYAFNLVAATGFGRTASTWVGVTTSETSASAMVSAASKPAGTTLSTSLANTARAGATASAGLSLQRISLHIGQ
jgi:hypothetical protein